MIPPTTLLLWFQILTSDGRPVRGAYMACEEVRVFNVEDGVDQAGGWMAPTDARGAMVFEEEPGDFHCTARKPGFQDWFGILSFTPTHTLETLYMEAE